MKHVSKTLSLLIVLTLYLNNPTIASAQCSNYTDPGICHSTPGCIYDGFDRGCVIDPYYNSTPPGTGSFSENIDQLATSIGLNPNLTTIPGIVNTAVPIAITFAGLILFLMLLSGGFTMLTSANNPEGAQKGKARITMAITGFVIIFAAYWIVEFLEIVLGLTIF